MFGKNQKLFEDNMFGTEYCCFPGQCDFKEDISIPMEADLNNATRATNVLNPSYTVYPKPSVNFHKDELQFRPRKVRSFSVSDLRQNIEPTIVTISVKATPSVSAISDNRISPYFVIVLDNQVSDQNVHQQPVGRPEFSANMLETEKKNDFLHHGERINRNHPVVTESWKSQLEQLLCDDNVDSSKPKNKKMEQDTQAKQLGPSCISISCKRNKHTCCDIFDAEGRRNIHNWFWKTMTYSQRKHYVRGLITMTMARSRKPVGEISRRRKTFSYFLPIDTCCSFNVRVCKKMFLQTLSLAAHTVEAWLKN